MYEELIRAGVPKYRVEKIIQYVESNKNEKVFSTLNNQSSIKELAIKYHNVGLTLDGVNVVVTGKNRAFITYIGFKNKVLSTYPEAEFDVQVVKEGDEFSFEKNSGEVTYHHKIVNPFTDSPIIGAYAFIKTNAGQVIEFLDRSTFENMKKSAMMKTTWNTWESEFWLKSVVKRACKRKFYDIVKDIESLDNEDYSPSKVNKDIEALDEDINSAIEYLKEAESLEELKKRWTQIDREIQQIKEVVEAKDFAKEQLSKEPK